MTTSTRDKLTQLAADVSSECARWYPQHIDPADLRQELALYVYDNETLMSRWLEKDELHRVVLALRGKTRQLGETAKAEASGYSFDDIHWYSPDTLQDLVPLALGEWDAQPEPGEPGMPASGGDPAEGGNLMAMVMDVRRVLTGSHWSVNDFDDSERGRKNLEWLSRRLGGDYPQAPGVNRRRACSNAVAINRTKEQG